MEDTKNIVINYATEVFMQNGCRRVTMDSIATALHISKRTLYEQFADKEELLTACLERIHCDMENRRMVVENHVKEPILRAMFLMRNAARSKNQAAVLMADAARCYPSIHKRFVQVHNFDFEDAVRRTLTMAQEEGLLRKGLDLESTLNSVKILINSVPKPTDDAPDPIRLKYLSEAGFTFIRGLLSVEAIEKYDTQEDEFKKLFRE